MEHSQLEPSLVVTLGHWLVSAIAILLTSKLVRGFDIDGFFAALVASVVIGLANMFIWPVLIFLTLPINILTLGLFTFVVNGIVLKICAAILPRFRIHTWFAAIAGSLILSLISSTLHWLLV